MGNICDTELIWKIAISTITASDVRMQKLEKWNEFLCHANLHELASTDLIAAFR